MSISDNLLTVFANNKTVKGNSSKVYEAGRMSIIKTKSLVGVSGEKTLKGCLNEPIYELSINPCGKNYIQIKFESGDKTKTVERSNTEYINEIVYIDGKVTTVSNNGQQVDDETEKEFGEQIKALCTYAGNTVVTSNCSVSVGYYQDVRQARYEEGEKDGKASESAKINYNFKRSKAAVCMRGGEIDMSAEIDKLPDAILNIPIDASIGFYSDEDTAHHKIVPNGAKGYAQLNKLGGMTYKCNNLIPFPYIHNGAAIEERYTETTKGITYTVMSNGGIHVEGTSTDDHSFYIASEIPFPINTDACISGGLNGNDGNSLVNVFVRKTTDSGNAVWISSLSDNYTGQLQEGESIYSVGLFIAEGKTVNTIIHPMLNYGTIPKPYEPYYKDLRDTKVTKIVSKGTNLIPFPYKDKSGKEHNGITYTVNDEDGSITANGTATAFSTFMLYGDSTFLKLNETYTMSGCPSGGSTDTYYIGGGLYVDSQYVAGGLTDTGTGRTSMVTAEHNKFYSQIAIKEGTVCNNLVFKPMLNYGSTALPSAPYRELTSYLIPDAVQALEGYGLGIDSCYNYVDFEKKQFVKQVHKLVLTGEEKWDDYNFQNYERFRLTQITPKAVWHREDETIGICNEYAYKLNVYKDANRESGILITTVKNTDTGVYSDTSTIFVRDPAYTSAEDFKAHLKEQKYNNTPVTLVYKLLEPEIIDISELLDNFIKVEGNGSIEFVNDYKNADAVPSKVTYMAPLPIEGGD